MQIVIFGHSYIRDLQRFCRRNLIDEFNVDSQVIKIKFITLPGACFLDFYNSEFFNELISYNLE